MHRTTRFGLAAFGAAALTVLAGCSSTGSGSSSIADPPRTTAAAPSFTASDAADGTQETTPPAPDLGSGGVDLTAKNVKLTTKVLEKDCFGSAGCNLTVRVDLGDLPAGTPEDASFEVTYELRGTSDGSTVGTISVEEGRYDTNEEYVQTSSSSKKVTAVVTDVEMTDS